jgi:uncharacterized membrane protein YbhN (UPF0104 family)
MSDDSLDAGRAAAERRSHRWVRSGALVTVAVAAAFLLVPALAGVPARLVEGCGKWIAAAGVLELLSALGFVAIFKLVFAARVSWRRGLPAGLRALGASTILPAGGLIGPTMGAWSTSAEKPSLSQLTRSTITFVILTNAPGAIVLAALGMLLWLGLPSGPHQTALTILPALLALTLLTSAWFAGRSVRGEPVQRRRILPHRLTRPAWALRDGLTEARALVGAGNWKLVGAVGYYALDNAVLWAAFHAYGKIPPLGVIVMGYLVGSLAGALPIPAGLGALDGGLFGALVLYGAPAAPAAAAVLLYRGISLSVPVALGAIGWTCSPADRPRRVDRRRDRFVGAALARRRAAAELASAHAD